ncbi:hypothetical protein [Limnobaculum parvum]|uniref:Uncharacterized protein n=1 Tax=Limnobaculum parvum TaxID=2172103 RepID=A0A2Y9TV52_9GAMM|nr:hypothetical protein [Limnobaculum parvum]AWH87334.1 hypothetical protein HYN51_01405 [Limnobaculum parvum]
MVEYKPIKDVVKKISSETSERLRWDQDFAYEKEKQQALKEIIQTYTYLVDIFFSYINCYRNKIIHFNIDSNSHLKYTLLHCNCWLKS